MYSSLSKNQSKSTLSINIDTYDTGNFNGNV